MHKKVLISFILLFLTISAFPVLPDAFSQQNIILKALRKGDKIYIRVLAPLNDKEVNAQIIGQDGEIKAIVHKDYYGMIYEEEAEYNEFIISNEKIKFNENDKIKLLSENILKSEETIGEIPYESITISNDETNRELRVMTYNIHHGKDKAGNSNLDFIVELIEKYDPDIIGLQEVDKNTARTNFTDQLKYMADKLSMYYYFGSNKSFINGEYGNGILSKYPIIDVQNIKLNGKETRGLLRCTILLDNTKVNFFVTHLGLDYDERNIQYKVINDYIDIYEDNLIMIGDFNSKRDDPNIIYLQNKLNDTGEKTLNSYYNTLNVFRNKQRIDYIFLNKDIKIKGYKRGKVDYSDHYPVIVDIEI